MILRMPEFGGTLEMSRSGLLKLVPQFTCGPQYRTEKQGGALLEVGEGGKPHRCAHVTKEP